MKNILLGLIVLSFFCIPHAYCQQWNQLPNTYINTPLKHITADDCDPQILFGATDTEVYRSGDGGTSWKRIYSIARSEDIIQKIIYKPGLSSEIYLITKSTVYYCALAERSWNKVVQNFSDNPITTLAVDPFDPATSYLGTAQGLYAFHRSVVSFSEINRFLKNESIRALSFHPNIKGLLFISTDRAFYRFDVRTYQPSRAHVFLDSSESGDDDQRDIALDHIAFFPDDDDTLFVLRNGRLYTSNDRGQTLKETGHNNTIEHIAPLSTSPHAIIADTRTVSFTNLETSEKNSYSNGMYSSVIHDIALHDFKQTLIYAATDRGLFLLQAHASGIEKTHTPLSLLPRSLDRFRRAIRAEPSINNTHAAAIRYANVANSKIDRWQRNARLRALWPTVSCGIDTAWDDTIDIDRGSTTIPDSYMFGPKSNSFSWDIDLKWDLADLVWNNDATTITYREKQMIEMREDILNEVTNLYFARRKKQLELFSHHARDSTEYLLLCMEIDELTARIDALTGSWFSQHIDKT